MKTNFKLGDAVTRLTRLLGMEHCEKCEKRRVILNELGEHGVKETVHRLKKLESELNDCCK